MSTSDVEVPTDDAAGPAPDEFDVFISYSSRDRDTVVRVVRRLRHLRLTPWFDRWNLTPGGEWQSELADGLLRSRACAVFIGPGDLGAWTRLEMSVALNRTKDDPGFRVFPVLLPGLEPFDPADLPPFLATRTWVDLRDGPESDRRLQDLVNAVHGVPFGPDVPASAEQGPGPYQGLEVFDEQHAAYFFGREAVVQRVTEKLRRGRFLALVGPSGSGKSSLVRAGLLPRIRAGGLGTAWWIVVLRPGAHPLAALAGRLAELRPGTDLLATADALAADPRTLHLTTAAVLADEAPESRVLVVVDQCEELFTVCRDDRQRAAFLSALHHASVVPDGRTAVVVTLRADFYARLARFPEVAQLVQSHQILVAGLTDQQLRQVIEEPARVAGLQIEPGLVDTILGDVVREPGSLPLLEHALLETWRRRRGTMLTLEGYRETGGVQRGLAARAEGLYAELGPECQDVARRLLLRLTQPGEGTGDTRRRASLAEVTSGSDSTQVDDVVRRLVAARLLTTSADEPGDQQWVEVSHEALIRGWPRLQGWIDADRAGLVVHRRLTSAAQEWQRLHRDEGALYRGNLLAEALAWRERGRDRLNDVEERFLAAGEKAERSSQTARRRRVVVGFVALVVALAVISIAALDAARARDVALSRQLAASGQNALALDPALGLALALRAMDTADTSQAEEVLRRATAEARGRLVLRGDATRVVSARFLPGQRQVASIGDDGRLRVWDLAARQVVADLPAHTGRAHQVRPSPDGRHVASVGRDGALVVTDLVTETSRVLAQAAEGQVMSGVAYRGDGLVLAAAAADGSVRVVDASTGVALFTTDAGETPVFGLAFSPDGKTLAEARGDGTVQLAGAADGAPGLVLRGHTGVVFSVAFDDTGRRLVTAGEDGTVRLWDAATGHEEKSLPLSAQWLYGAAFSPDGDRIVACGRDGVVRVWDVDGVELVALRGHVQYAFDATFDDSGDTVLSAGEDGSVRTWDVGAGAAARAPVTMASFSPDGQRVITGGVDGHTRVWAVDRLVPQLDLPAAPARRWAAFSGDGQRLAAGGEDGDVVVGDADGRNLVTLHPHTGPVWAGALDRSGDRLVTGGQDFTVTVSSRTGPPRVLEGHSGAVYTVAFSPDGRFVLSAGADATVRLWDDADRVRVFEGHRGTVLDVAFSRDGLRFASAGTDGTVRIWDIADGSVTVLRGHDGGAAAVRFSPDGRQVASAGDDGTVRVWDVQSSRLLLTLPLFEGPATAVDFGPDGRTLVSASERDGVVRTSACEVCGPVEEVVALARTRPVRTLTPDEEQRWVS